MYLIITFYYELMTTEYAGEKILQIHIKSVKTHRHRMFKISEYLCVFLLCDE